MVEQTVADAREAVAVAASDESDDEDRDQSVALSRRAFEQYATQFAALKSEDEAKGQAFEKSVGADVEKLKEELYASRKQRTWIAVTGWF